MSTFRADLVTHLMTVGNAYRTAHPTLLRRVWSARPGGFGELPCMYIGQRPETSPDDDTGTATREIVAEVVIVDGFGDNEQLTDRMDVLVDGLASLFRSSAYATVAGGVIDAVSGVFDGELTVTNPTTDKSTIYRTATLSIKAHIQEGRT